MTDDVRQALDRFQNFVGRFGSDAVIDARSGFSTGDAVLLIGEIELAAHSHLRDRDMFDR